MNNRSARVGLNLSHTVELLFQPRRENVVFALTRTWHTCWRHCLRPWFRITFSHISVASPSRSTSSLSSTRLAVFSLSLWHVMQYCSRKPRKAALGDEAFPTVGDFPA